MGQFSMEISRHPGAIPRGNQHLWQTDFTYLKVIGWGWFYPSSILDDYSRYIVAWKLCTNMRGDEVTDTLTLALETSGFDQIDVAHPPRLLSDNGASYIAGDLAECLEDKGMDHVRGAPNHPQTRCKIKRWHQTLKNRILLENYFLPGDLEAKIQGFVDHYTHRRYHESISNPTPADVYFGRAAAILERRAKIKKRTIRHRRLCRQPGRLTSTGNEPGPPFTKSSNRPISFDDGHLTESPSQFRLEINRQSIFQRLTWRSIS